MSATPWLLIKLIQKLKKRGDIISLSEIEERDIFFMRKAITLAKNARLLGEVPVGAVIVREDVLLSAGLNLRETKKNALAHAEIVAIDGACSALSSWRLDSCTLYVTLEPCAMCAGAIISARINRVVYGASDPTIGAAGSVAQLFDMPFLHRPSLRTGVLGKECAELMQSFFTELRGKEKPPKGLT